MCAHASLSSTSGPRRDVETRANELVQRVHCLHQRVQPVAVYEGQYGGGKAAIIKTLANVRIADVVRLHFICSTVTISRCVSNVITFLTMQWLHFVTQSILMKYATAVLPNSFYSLET